MKNLRRRLEQLEKRAGPDVEFYEDLSHLSIEEIKALLDAELEKASLKPLPSFEEIEELQIRACGKAMPEYQRKYWKEIFDQRKRREEHNLSYAEISEGPE